MKNIAKSVAFLLLMSIYLLATGGPGWRTLYGQKLAMIFGFAAIMALWFGSKPVGTLNPATMRPLFIFVGILLMVTIFILMWHSRDVMRHLDRSADKVGMHCAF